MNRHGGYLRSIEISRPRVDRGPEFPFSLPALRNLESLVLDPRITFFVGDNGTGKSTLLEAIAIAAGFNPEGGTRNFTFSTRRSESGLHACLRLIRGAYRPKTGYFLRAESFFNLATEIERLDAEPLGGPPVINSYGRRSLHEQSHGESFVALFTHRFGSNGLYLLDEPEAALSPLRQLAFLHRMRDLAVSESCQFLVATHSPLIMAAPGALIYNFSDRGVEAVAYEATEHYQVTKAFFERKDAFLKELLDA